MSNRVYRVTLSPSDRATLKRQLSAGSASTRLLTRARILLKVDESPDGPSWSDRQVMEAFDVSPPTVIRVRQRYSEAGLKAALQRRPPRREYRRKLDGAQEAQLIALACSPPPMGRRQWSLRLLAGKAVELEFVDGLSYETVRQLLKKNCLKPWLTKRWVLPARLRVREGIAFSVRQRAPVPLGQRLLSDSRPDRGIRALASAQERSVEAVKRSLRLRDEPARGFPARLSIH